MFIKILQIVVLMTPTIVFASSSSHHTPSASDLIAPIFNFVVFAGGLLYLLRNKVRSAFNEFADSVQSQFNSAENKNKEATLRVETYEKKMNDLDSITAKIKKDADKDLDTFNDEYKVETQEIAKRMEKDYIARIDSEIIKINKEVDIKFVDLIISKAKEKVGQDKDLKKKITTNLLGKL